jgi:rhamnogalacturonan endolyase
MKLSPLAQRYDGLAKTVTATTTPADLTVNITYDGVDTGAVYPGPHTVVGTIQDENYEGTYTDTLVIGITALVRHAPTLNGELDGSLQLLSGESFSVNSSGLVSGDVLLPGAALVQLNGTSNVVGVKDGPGGVAPSNYNVTINSGAVVRYAVRRVDPIGVATVDAPPAPAGTRDVTLNSADQSAGDFATLRNLTLNSNAGSVAVPAGTYGTIAVNGSSTLVLGVANSTEPVVYNLQTLTVNSKAKVQVVGPVILTLGTASSFNGCVNGAGNPAILTLRIASGDLTLNSGSTLRASLIAPTSIVTLNSGSSLTGEVVANYLVVNGVLAEP